MTRTSFIEHVREIVGRVQESAMGIGDWMGEASPEDAAEEIADLVPPIAWSDQ
jgi:hypothetical protein